MIYNTTNLTGNNFFVQLQGLFQLEPILSFALVITVFLVSLLITINNARFSVALFNSLTISLLFTGFMDLLGIVQTSSVTMPMIVVWGLVAGLIYYSKRS